MDAAGRSTFAWEPFTPRGVAAFARARLGRLLLVLNMALIRVWRGLFSYQIFVRAAAKPSVEHLLSETIDFSRKQRKTIEDSGVQRMAAV